VWLWKHVHGDEYSTCLVPCAKTKVFSRLPWRWINKHCVWRNIFFSSSSHLKYIFIPLDRSTQATYYHPHTHTRPHTLIFKSEMRTSHRIDPHLTWNLFLLVAPRSYLDVRASFNVSSHGVTLDVVQEARQLICSANICKWVSVIMWIHQPIVSAPWIYEGRTCRLSHIHRGEGGDGDWSWTVCVRQITPVICEIFIINVRTKDVTRDKPSDVDKCHFFLLY